MKALGFSVTEKSVDESDNSRQITYASLDQEGNPTDDFVIVSIGQDICFSEISQEYNGINIKSI